MLHGLGDRRRVDLSMKSEHSAKLPPESRATDTIQEKVTGMIDVVDVYYYSPSK